MFPLHFLFHSVKEGENNFCDIGWETTGVFEMIIICDSVAEIMCQGRQSSTLIREIQTKDKYLPNHFENLFIHMS